MTIRSLTTLGLLFLFLGSPRVSRANDEAERLNQRLAEQERTIADLTARLSHYESNNAAASAEPSANYGGVCGGLCDNLAIFAGLEGSKQPQEFGVNAHFGGRLDANAGLALCPEYGLGLQVGTALNITDNAVQVFEAVGSSTGRVQSYTTVGVFQRSECLVWAVAYDLLYEDYYDSFFLGQWRGQAGWQLDPCNEVGVRFALADFGDNGVFRSNLPPIPVALDPITQGSLYVRRTWESGADTTFWLGLAEGHGERNLAFPLLLIPERGPKDEMLLFGAELHVPLNDSLALFGQGNFLMPADTGTVDAYLGVVFYPGGGAFQARRKAYAPVLPVANSTTFSVDLDRRAP